MIRPIFGIVVSSLAIGGARAGEIASPFAAWDENWTCGTAISVSEPEVRALDALGRSTHYAGASKLPGFSVATLPSPELGLILLAKSSDGWRAFPIEEGGASQGVFVAPEEGRLAIVSMLSREGPGQSFTLAQSDDGLRTLRCTEIPFPAELNKPAWANEFLTPDHFNIDAKGRGTLIGSAFVDRNGREQTLLYRYTSNDGGLTWSAPKRINHRVRRPPDGIFTQLPDETDE